MLPYCIADCKTNGLRRWQHDFFRKYVMTSDLQKVIEKYTGIQQELEFNVRISVYDML